MLHLCHSSFSNPSFASPTSQDFHLHHLASRPWYRTQICQLSFTHNPTRSPSKNAGLLVSYRNCQAPPLTTCAANLKQHTNSSSNHVTSSHSTSINPPYFTLSSVALTLLSVFSILLLKKATVLVESFSSISYQLSVGPTMQISYLRPGTYQSSKAAFCKSAFAKTKLTFGKSAFAQSRFAFRQSIFASQKAMVWPSATSKMLSPKMCSKPFLLFARLVCAMWYL